LLQYHVRQASRLAQGNLHILPQPLESVQTNKQNVKLYPVVDLTMKPPKCAHAFQINKTALAAPGTNQRAMLNALGTQLNLSAIINGVLSDWTHHFHRNWCNYANLLILLFYNNAGNQVNNTTTENNSAVLLPVINGPLGGYRN
jgi:hypothetical protein